MYKKITWPTNYNKKLECDGMVHIDLPPKEPVSNKVLKETVIEIKTSDESAPSTKWRLDSIFPLKLYQLTDISTLPSHGLESFDFAKWFITNYEGSSPQTEVAVYFYYKIVT